MKSKLLFSTIAIVVMLGVCSLTYAWAGVPSTLFASAQRDRNFRSVIGTVFTIVDSVRDLIREVNLTDAQKQSIKTIVHNARPQAQQLHQQLKAKRLELREVLLAAEPDSARIQALSNDISQLAGQLAAHRIQTAAQISQVLTPEQKQTALNGLKEIDPLIEELKEELQGLAIRFGEKAH
ncbi:MAG: Spy/CpxP family protein refolding chaperone [Acidobacteriota bacterium]